MHRIVRCWYASVAVAASIFAAPAGGASAQTPAAQPSAAASPSASAAPRALGLRTSLDAALTSIAQSTRGPGQIGPEAPGFIAGAPLAPNTPYDLFSSAPQTPGVAGIGQAIVTAAYGFRTFDATIAGGFADVDGSVTNAAYWGESLFPALNPHLGARALPYRIAFPAHAGEDDGRTSRASLLGASLASADGDVRVRGRLLRSRADGSLRVRAASPHERESRDRLRDAGNARQRRAESRRLESGRDAIAARRIRRHCEARRRHARTDDRRVAVAAG